MRKKLCGQDEKNVDAITKSPDSTNLFYSESSRTTTRQQHPLVPADYFMSLPDGDACDRQRRRLHRVVPSGGEWVGKREKAWRKKRWPRRPRLLHPADFRQ